MSTLPRPLLQKKITPRSPLIKIVEGNEAQRATKANPLIAWLVTPPLDESQCIANENFARSIVKSLGASQLLFRHCDHFSSRALDLNKTQWWFLTDWHITVFVEIDGQFLQGDIYFHIDGSGTFVLLPDDLRLDVDGRGVELHPHYEPDVPSSLRVPRLGYVSQATRLACAIASNRRHWYVPKRKRSDWNPTKSDQALEQLEESTGVSAFNLNVPDISVPPVSAATISLILGVLERRKNVGISLPRKQYGIHEPATRQSGLEPLSSCLQTNDTQTEQQLTTQQAAKDFSLERQGSVQITNLSPKRIEQKTVLQIPESHATSIPTENRKQNQRIAPGRRGTRGRGLRQSNVLLNRPQTFEEWKRSHGIPIKPTTTALDLSTTTSPMEFRRNAVADTKNNQPKQAEILITEQTKAEGEGEDADLLPTKKIQLGNTLNPPPSVTIDPVLDMEGWTIVVNPRRRARKGRSLHTR